MNSQKFALCLKNNGKVKMVYNQHELASLDKEKYTAYLIQVGLFSSVFKGFKPDSKWLKPIKKIEVYYSIDRLMTGSFEYYNDTPEPESYISEYNTSHVIFTDIFDFIFFIVSLDKLASFNVLSNGGFGHATYLTGFHMIYEGCDGSKADFEVPKKLRKKGCIGGNGFAFPTLITALMQFFEDKDKIFRDPLFCGRKYAYISTNLQTWDYKPHSDRDLVTVPMVTIGCCTLVWSSIHTVLDTLKYNGKIDVMVYECIEEEDNLPFGPLTGDLIEYYSTQFFELYDDYSYNIITAADIIEMAVMLPYYIKTVRDLGSLSDDELVRETSKERSIIGQLKLCGKNIEDIPLKHIVYESELDGIEMDETLSMFVKSLILWIKDPNEIDIDGLTENDVLPF